MGKKLMAFSITAVIGASSLLFPIESKPVFAEDLNKKKQQIQQEKSNVDSNINNKQDQISDLKAEQDKLDKEIKRIDLQVADTNGKIRKQEESITTTKKEIDELKKKIEEVKKRIEERNEVLKERARSLQQSGGAVGYLDVLLGAQDFGDLVSRISAVSTIVEADKEILKAHERDMKILEQAEADLNSKLKKLEKALKELETLKKELNSQIAEKEKLMAKVEKEHDEAVHELHKLEDEAAFLKEQEKIIKAEEARQKAAAEAARKRAAEEAKRAQEAAAKSSSSSSSSEKSSVSSSAPAPAVTSGTFMWPANGSFTSGFKHRWGKLHAGIDIANSAANVPVVAAADGTVIRSYYSSSYGNVIFVSHNIDGKVFTTVYAHLEERLVSGGSVSKGQQIGLMGNTGRSFGKHLHFEIHNGPWNGQANAVDPLTYLQ
ncbi:murein hydrolase activator EnvC family protein [Metabacillus fastidiosus]|uniref:murein hydrolase activator EnvC family protein n=1 Tax=Metabacillus fastidiosus TaxID=1458 RepID=UPI003D2D7A8D